jgi:hypothetical protein
MGVRKDIQTATLLPGILYLLMALISHRWIAVLLYCCRVQFDEFSETYFRRLREQAY